MNAIEALQAALDRAAGMTVTENGDPAHTGSGSYCLDLFALCGGMRRNIGDLAPLFEAAFAEDRETALKIMLYCRDIRGGLGERDVFRAMLGCLARLDPDAASRIAPLVPEYGRYDDLLVLLGTGAEDAAVAVMKARIAQDEVALADGGGVSLLGKWLPSINASSAGTVALAKKLARRLGLSAAEYRRLCSRLRAGRVLEDRLRRRDYTFDYEKQPSQALFRYRHAFACNDGVRYAAFLEQVKTGAAKLNAGTLYPYQIIAPFMDAAYFSRNEEERRQRFDRLNGGAEGAALEASWNALDRAAADESRTIVVRDGSGSMLRYGGASDSPANIATSLAILFSEQLPAPFKNTFITFSASPRLVRLPEGTLFEKTLACCKYAEIANTDIMKVYRLLLDTAKNAAVPKEEMIRRVLIISDMEFDDCAEGVPSFEAAQAAFARAGYDMPEIVFWNVAARGIRVPVTMNEHNVKLVSGASPRVFSQVLADSCELMTPFQFMEQVLEKYALT
jgi:phosphoribosylformylglycinamidine (FGAM) synthase PurS component